MQNRYSKNHRIKQCITRLASLELKIYSSGYQRSTFNRIAETQRHMQKQNQKKTNDALQRQSKTRAPYATLPYPIPIS